jgi:transposase
VLKGVFRKKVLFSRVTFAELKIQVTKIEPGLSAEGKMLVALFMPFCESQQQKIKELEDKLAINSSNSSKPPSKDDFKPPKARYLRKKTTKKPGGQVGHKGLGGKLKDNPDDTINYFVGDCPGCGHNLKDVTPDGFIRKQIEDIPPLRTIVTEHRIELKTCPCCAVQWQAGGCPPEVRHEFEYGPRIKAICVYLSAFQFIPAKRTKQMMEIFGVELSTGTLDNFRKSASRKLEGFLDVLRLSIISSCAGFFDETGMKVKGLGHWAHVAATTLFSLFILHPKRGREAHDDMGVLKLFKGILHRDDYSPYHNYPWATHSLCVAHLLRDLIYAIDRNGQEEWADPLIKLLVKIKEQVERSKNGTLDRGWQGRHRKKYRRLIASGLDNNPLAVKKNGSTRGRTAQTKTVNLLLRLRDKEDEVLRFMTHAHARFDNNQAERDLRMNKVRQKISGGFRSLKAGQEFMNVRSFVATAIKRGADPVEELVKLFTPGNTDYMRLDRHPE